MVNRLGPGAEFDLIRAFLADVRGTGPDVRVGPGDDCAIVGEGIALSVDMTVEDVHFRRSWLPMGDIGYHAAAGALSDLAAVAARPVGLLAAVALGPGDETRAGRELMEGVVRAARDADAAILGGDVTRSPGPVALDIVAVGKVDEPVLRSGARPGDELWVTGSLGAAAAAVEAWLADRTPSAEARAAYARPAPRLREARWLAERDLPTAM
ncbi:MAG: thiamine-phosphate kinase, partial [Gemmatimonadota bacterium]